MKLVIQKSISIVTPTTLRNDLIFTAIDSVKEQDSKDDVIHVIVVDGENLISESVDSLRRYERLNEIEDVKVIVLPWNTGKEYYGHRIYAAMGLLSESDYTAFLDEDNFYKSNHVSSLVDLIQSKNLDFAYSMRSIYDVDGTYLLDDECESLGKWPVWPALARGEESSEFGFLVDTSSYMFNTEFLQRNSHLWVNKWGGDRLFFSKVRFHPNRHNSTLQHTLCYRLDGNPKSVTKEFFEKGNEFYLNYHRGELPWKQ